MEIMKKPRVLLTKAGKMVLAIGGEILYTQRSGGELWCVYPCLWCKSPQSGGPFPKVGQLPTTLRFAEKLRERGETGMTGQYFHNIDAKGRLFIPAKLREQLGDTLHVTVGQDGCLSVYSDTEWEKFQQKLDERNFTDVKKLRLMFAYMADCEPDAQGRILIPNHLRQRAKLEKEVVVAGIFNRVEIWNAQRWAELEEEAFSSGSLEQAMEEMGL